jgi:KaiC/GvpD/RAD55 family RecA-like ATPase
MNASSASPVNFAPKHLSGIDVIDNAWGGLYRGGSYLVYGRAASGRGLLTLMFARTGAALGEPTLFISPDRQKDLMIQAASIGFNLREAYDSGIVRLVRVPPLMNLQNMGDDGVSRALWDLVTLIRQHRPTRLVMNDFMPFVAFRSYDRFRNEFIQFLEQIDSLETTTMLVMPEPANQQSSRVIEFMASQMTGSIRIELGEDSPSTTKRRISLIPHIGHIKRQVVDYWDLEDLVVTAKAPAQEPAPAPKSQAPIFTAAPEEAPRSAYGTPAATQQHSAFEEEQPIFTPSSVQGPGAGFGVGFQPAPAPQQHSRPQEHPYRPTPSVEQAFYGQDPAQVPHRDPAPAPQQTPATPPPSFHVEPPAPQVYQPAPGSYSMPPASTPPPTFEPSPAPPPQPVTPSMQTPPPAPPPSASPWPTEPSASAFQPTSNPFDVDYSDREAFRRKLDMAFSDRETMHQPFLLLALRMDRSSQQVRPFDFDFLMDLVRAELGAGDDMLAVTDIERMVVLLGNSRAEEAQSFFARLKDRLRQESPQQADHLLHSVSAIVVPDGKPFKTASEFLSYALDQA